MSTMVDNSVDWCGLIVTVGDVEASLVPLSSASIQAHIIDSVAEVTIEHHYVNKGDQAIETIFKFPLDESAAVCRFSAQVDDRLIEGVVKDTEETQDDYDEAIQSGHAAFFLRETLPDVFKVKTGRLVPGAAAKIRLTYVTELKVECGDVRFCLPRAMAPRFIPHIGTRGTATDLASIPQTAGAPFQMEFEARIHMSVAIKEIRSPTHKIAVHQDQPCRSVVKLDDSSGFLDRDLILYAQVAEPHQPRLIYEKSETGSRALMLSLVPWCSLKAAEQKVELIFLVDRSGSMEGKGIQQAKRALKFFLHSLPTDCYVNVISFGFNHLPLFPASRKYDDQVLSEGESHVDAMEANMGGTEIYAPLEWIFQQAPIPGYLRHVFVLTDGEVSNEDQVISLVRRHNSQARVFAIGLGSGASHRLVDGIARGGNGTALFATLDDRLETKVVQQLENALQPTAMDVNLGWEGYSGRDATPLRQIPAKCPPVFDGKHLVVYALLEEGAALPDSVTLTATTPAGPLSIKLALNQSNFAESQLIHRLAAKKWIQQLQDAQPTDDVMREIIELGCRYGLVSCYTSYVAVDPRQPDAPPKESWMMVKSRDVPNTMAFEWIDAPCSTVTLSAEPTPDENPNLQKKATAAITDEQLMQLVSRQSFDGSFQDAETLAQLLNATVEDVRRAGRNGGCSEPIWTTVLALAFLSVALPQLHSSWNLLANKAHKWLRRSSSVTDESRAQQEAETFVRVKLNVR